MKTLLVLCLSLTVAILNPIQSFAQNLNEVETEVSEEKKDKKEKTEKVKKEKIKEAKQKDKPEKVKEPKTPKEKKVKDKPEKEEKVKKEKKVADFRAKKPLRSWSISVTPGFTNPYTDLKYTDFFGTFDPKSEFRPGVGVSVTKMLSNAFGVQGSFLYANLTGVVDSNLNSKEDIKHLQNAGINRGTYFNTSMTQVGVNLYWNISNTIFGMNRYYKAQQYGEHLKERRWSLYAYSGVAVNFFNSKIHDLATDTELTNANNPNFIPGDATEMVVPFGLGLKYKISNTIDLGIDQSYHFVFTDKLDGFILNHPNRAKNDKFSFTGVSLTIKLGSKNTDSEHYEWVNGLESVMADFSRIEKKVDRLTSDSDGDGVADAFDKESDTPEDVRVDGSGRTMDVDYDGIPDYADVELFTDDPLGNEEVAVDDFGKALDSDGDGIADHSDLEPNTPKGNLVNFEGISIAETLEITPGSSAGGGAPSTFESVYFDYNSSRISREFDDELFAVARAMKMNKSMKLYVIGNTDVRGTEEYNEALGKKRAENVVSYLVKNYDIEENRFTIESKGEKETASSMDNVNRRVDFVIQ